MKGGNQAKVIGEECFISGRNGMIRKNQWITKLEFENIRRKVL